MPLVLSLFPGIGLLDMAFEEVGFTVVRGPDLLWGGDIKRFHVPAGKFDGVIGGPPCPPHSDMGNFARGAGQVVAEDLIPEFARIVQEALPRWFVMENVEDAPCPTVGGYVVDSILLNNRECFDGTTGAEQNRVRRFAFGDRELSTDGLLFVQRAALQNPVKSPCVTANATVWDAVKKRPHGDKSSRYLKEAIRLQGLPEGFLDRAPFTVAGKIKVVGNGVPLPMGRTIAKAVARAVYGVDSLEEAS